MPLKKYKSAHELSTEDACAVHHHTLRNKINEILYCCKHAESDTKNTKITHAEGAKKLKELIDLGMQYNLQQEQYLATKQANLTRSQGAPNQTKQDTKNNVSAKSWTFFTSSPGNMSGAAKDQQFSLTQKPSAPKESGILNQKKQKDDNREISIFTCLQISFDNLRYSLEESTTLI